MQTPYPRSYTNTITFCDQFIIFESDDNVLRKWTRTCLNWMFSAILTRSSSKALNSSTGGAGLFDFRPYLHSFLSLDVPFKKKCAFHRSLLTKPSIFSTSFRWYTSGVGIGMFFIEYLKRRFFIFVFVVECQCYSAQLKYRCLIGEKVQRCVSSSAFTS